MEEIPAGVINGGMFISGGLVLAGLKLLASLWKSRNQRTEITPQPLEVRASEQPQTLKECRSLMGEMFGRVAALERITAALDERMKDIAEIKADIKTLMRSGQRSVTSDQKFDH